MTPVGQVQAIRQRLRASTAPSAWSAPYTVARHFPELLAVARLVRLLLGSHRSARKRRGGNFLRVSGVS